MSAQSKLLSTHTMEHQGLSNLRLSKIETAVLDNLICCSMNNTDKNLSYADLVDGCLGAPFDEAVSVDGVNRNAAWRAILRLEKKGLVYIDRSYGGNTPEDCAYHPDTSVYKMLSMQETTGEYRNMRDVWTPPHRGYPYKGLPTPADHVEPPKKWHRVERATEIRKWGEVCNGQRVYHSENYGDGIYDTCGNLLKNGK